MEKISKNGPIRCVFCHSDKFALPYKGYKPHHGSFVVCANCGQENDYTSLYLIVKRKAHEFSKEVASEMLSEFKKGLAKSFKGNRNFKVTF